MPTVAIALWTLLLLAAAALVYWSAAWLRVARTLRARPFAELGLVLADRATTHPRVACVIPAHNEEAALRTLIPSLRGQDYPRLRFVLSLDRCTDRSAQVVRELIAGDERFVVLDIRHCLEGWAGKTSAVQQGIAALGAQTDDDELLLFADADTIFHPRCVSAAVALLRERDLDLLSLLSTMTYERWFEWLVQPSAGMELLRHYPIDRIFRQGRGARPFANGQFMLFRRRAYDTIGGHAMVKEELLEDLALARAVQEGWHGWRRDEGGGRLGLFFAGDMLRCRMYESWRQFDAGWRRIFIESARRRIRRLWSGLHVNLWLGGVLPIALVGGVVWIAVVFAHEGFGPERLLATATLALGVLTLLTMLGVLVAAYRLGRTPLWAVVLRPIGAIVTSWVLARAIRDLRTGRPVRWAGKEYHRVAR